MGKNDDPGGCPATVLGGCDPVCARCGRDLGVEARRQSEYRGGRIYRRTLYVRATEWLPVDPEETER